MMYALTVVAAGLLVGGDDAKRTIPLPAPGSSSLRILKTADADKRLDPLPPTQVLDHGGFFRPTALGGRDLILLSLAFSRDGKMIASAGGGNLGGRDGPARAEVKLWEVSTGQALRTIAVENGIVFHATFSPDGKLLVTGSGSGTAGEICFWNPATGELVRKLQGHSRGVYGVAFSPDGKVLASGSYTADADGKNEVGEIKLWDLKTGQELRTLRGHTGVPGALAFSADGKTLASGGNSHDGQVKLWDVAAGTDLTTLGLKGDMIHSVAFAPKAATLLVLSDNPGRKEQRPPYTVQVSLWDTIEKKQVKAATIRNGNVYRMALSHKGDLIACACHDGVKVYDVAKQAEVRSLPSKFRMRPLAFSPDDGLLAAGSDDGTVKLWSVAKLRE
jgi:WD40 repeat protein